MPYTIPSGAILEASIQGRSAGQLTLSVFHYVLDTPGGVADGAAEIDAFNLEWNTSLDFVGVYADCCSTEFAIENIVYQWIYPNRYRRVIKTPAETAGTVSQPSFPPNVSGAITKQADVATRHGIGTLHMPGVPNGSNDDGYVTISQKARYGALGTFLSAPYRTSTLFPVLYRRLAPNASAVVTAATVRDTMRVVRRRTVGVGI